MSGTLKTDTLAMETIAYHLFVRGFLSQIEIKNLIKEGYVKYQSRYLYDPLEKEWNFLSPTKRDKRSKGWEYDNWEYDYSSKDRVLSEFLEIFEARTGDEVVPEDDEPGAGNKPVVADASVLQKRVHGRLNEGRPIIEAALAVLVPGKQDWQEAAMSLVRMEDEAFHEKVDGLIREKGAFAKLWDLLAYDGYVIPELGGPVISAYKRVLRGQLVENLGDHRWILTQPEVRQVYLIVQTQVALARSYRRMIEEAPERFGEGLAQDFHSTAYRAGAIYYAARRWKQAKHDPPAEGEHVPNWIDVFELATPESITVVFHMEAELAREYLRHLFRVTLEKHQSLSQLLLAVLYDHCGGFARDIEKKDFIEETRDVVASATREQLADVEIVTKQQAAACSHPYWGPFFEAFPEPRWQQFMRAWWDALAYDCLGLGARWEKQEQRWTSRIIGYEAYIDMPRFLESVGFALEDFYGLYCPRSWGG